MEMSSGRGTKAVGGRLAVENLQSVDAFAVASHWQLNGEQLARSYKHTFSKPAHTCMFFTSADANL